MAATTKLRPNEIIGSISLSYCIFLIIDLKMTRIVKKIIIIIEIIIFDDNLNLNVFLLTPKILK